MGRMGRAEYSDIVTVSVPFTCGVGTAALIPLSGSSPAAFSAVSAALVCSIVTAILALRRPDGKLWIPLYFFLGLFCRCSAVLTGASLFPGETTAGRACLALKSVIDGIAYPHEESGELVKALLTGDRSGLDRGTVELFRKSGAAHMLALSGLHLGLIYLIVRKLFAPIGNAPLPKLVRSLGTVALTLFYTLMTGEGPSTVRAFLYILIKEAASLSPGRKADPVRVLLASLGIQLTLNPMVISQTGFQLSYLAMMGLATVFPAMKAWYPPPETDDDRRDPMRKLWNAASLSLSCQLFTAPLVWLRFRSFPRYFLITNIRALPMCSGVMVLSVGVVALSAAGLCPGALVKLDDALIRLLIKTLETISVM